MRIYLIPFCYFIRTRLKTKENKIGFLAVYLIPLLFIFYSLCIEYGYSTNILHLLMAILLVYSVYELGYIYNDTITVAKGEEKPTERLSRHELDIFWNNCRLILVYRHIYILLVCFLCWLILGGEVGSKLILASMLLYVTFYLYNNNRTKWNLIYHFILCSLRYTIPILFIHQDLIVFVGILFLYPILNLIERAREKRYAFVSKKFIFAHYEGYSRTIYYLVLFAFYCGFYWFIGDVTIEILAKTALFLLLFRGAGDLYSKIYKYYN